MHGRQAPREGVQPVAIDLSEAYRQAIQMVLPDRVWHGPPRACPTRIVDKKV